MVLTIDWIVFGGGIFVGIIIGLAIWVMSRLRKPKIDLHNIKKLVYDNGIKSKEIFEAFKELESIFKEMEKT